jgi:hypothetical protein
MAIFQNQPINLDAIKGISPERFVRQAEREQQAIVGDFFRMQQGIQQGIQQFEQKREEKQNMEISLRMLKEMGYGGMSDDALKAGIKSAGGPMQFLEGMTRIQAARTPKPSAFQEKHQALLDIGYSPREATLTLLQELGDEGISPVSTGAISSAELEAEAQGYEFNEETGKYEKKIKGEGAGFFGTLGNILSPGQPFGETYTKEMSPEMLQGITGMEQSQMIRAAEARRRNTNPLDPAGILD